LDQVALLAHTEYATLSISTIKHILNLFIPIVYALQTLLVTQQQTFIHSLSLLITDSIQ
jgi:hypothetical protein